jgi:hypothetical protein
MRALNSCDLLGNDNPVSRGLACACVAADLFSREQYNVERFCHNIYDSKRGGRAMDDVCLAFPEFEGSSYPHFRADATGAKACHDALVELCVGVDTPDAHSYIMTAYAPYSCVPNPVVFAADVPVRVPFAFSRDEKHAALKPSAPDCGGDDLVSVLRGYAQTVPQGYQTLRDCAHNAVPTNPLCARIPEFAMLVHVAFRTDAPHELYRAAAMCPRICMTDPALLRVVAVLHWLSQYHHAPLEICSLIATYLQHDMRAFYGTLKHPRIGLPLPSPGDPLQPLSLVPLSGFLADD